MKLLIAEDDVFFTKLLGQILSTDYELTVVGNGDEAWAALQHPEAPRLAILDWVMPGLSGPDICRKVRASVSLSSMYLILLTARNRTADIISGLRAGADDFITKPPVPAELRARVRMGERILGLQEAVTSQSALANRASEREKGLRELLNQCPLSPSQPCKDSLTGSESYSLQNCRLPDCSRNRWPETGSPMNKQLPLDPENPHSRS